MIVAEYHFDNAIVRIHDDYIEDDPTPILKKLAKLNPGLICVF